MLKEPSLKMQALMTNKILIESIFHSILAYFEKSLISKQIRFKIRGRCWQHPKMGLLNEVVLVKKGGSFPRVTIIP